MYRIFTKRATILPIQFACSENQMTNVCLFAKAIGYPEGGGLLWLYLNWALGLRSCGCNVIWLETAPKSQGPDELRKSLLALKTRLQPYGFANSIALYRESEELLPDSISRDIVSLEAATASADLLLDINYSACRELVQRFRRSALLDIDPGQTQVWISNGFMQIASHDLYFTIGENVGRKGARFPDCGLTWIYTPPCIALDWWPACDAPPMAAYTTISQWYGSGGVDGEPEWFVDGEYSYENTKRAGFLPFLDLPRHANISFELALGLNRDTESRIMLREHGWLVREAAEVSSTPWLYQQYIQSSRGEFSCAKPSYVRLQTAWISDRTLCYLASGKPAVVEYTGPSEFLPTMDGLLRFSNFEEAVDRLKDAETRYSHHSKAARALAMEFFDAKKVVRTMLERSL
jgi:hypothetical protein